MVLYNDFLKQMVENKSLEDFLKVFRQEEQTKGHVIFFGLPENYCKYKQSEIEWNESIYHREEAKVGCIFNVVHDDWQSLMVISEYWMATGIKISQRELRQLSSNICYIYYSS